jgi:hypothetical protein
MARRNYPFNKRDLRFGTNLVSTLIAWSIAAPFAIGNSSSKSASAYDDEPISKTFAVVLIIIGIALIPIFVPFIKFVEGSIFSILIGLPIGIWIGIILLVIQAFIADKENKKPKDIGQVIADDCNDMIKTIIKCTENTAYNSIRTKYYEIINNNNKIHPDIIKLQKKVTVYKNSLITNRLSEEKRKYCQDIIVSSLLEIDTLKSKHYNQQDLKPYREPMIIIDKDYHYTAHPYFSGYAYIEINKQFDNKQTICINDEQFLADKGIINPRVSEKPLKPLLGKHIQILLYDSFLILSNRKDFAVIGYENILSSYNKTVINISFDVTKTSYPSARRNIISHTDSTPEIKFEDEKIYAILEAGLLEFEFYSQKINIVFTKYKEGKQVYNIMQKITDSNNTNG